MTENPVQDAKPGAITEHPLLLTTLVLYSIVLGLPLSQFPPIDSPSPADLFIFGLIVLLLVRIALTLFHAAVATAYPGRLFVLEVSIAVIAAWQFRVLLDPRVNVAGSRLWLFYVLYLPLILTFFLWERLQHAPVRAGLLRVGLRFAALFVVVAGFILERPEVETGIRMSGRWVVAWALTAVTGAYALSKPWRPPRSI